MHETSPNSEPVFEALSRTTTDAKRLSQDGGSDTDLESTDDVDRTINGLCNQVDDALPVGEFQFDEAIVKENLEDILLLLVALHDGTHGKQLLSDLSRIFETELSPGTVYPCLHDLEERGVLTMHAKVQTKEYSIEDEEYVRAAVERTMVQHLAFGLLLSELLPQLGADDQ
ncbi:PadR family transcriptional regulator [Natronococcus pandeyae]|uniref:PadR family transcriptional regulator n=1 Tax=Natronococcus pandeyae TaxID=2055836 RepID=A0A8J8Q705_9EURY|nr:PadR family transcriptional regulator [Natronococcus pandeyae]TYL38415.1 PadR family transcriptional regulator [Natronococcus pandeyae]